MKLKTGGSGKSFNDRKLAGEVRTLTLNKMKVILTKEYDKETEHDNWSFQRELILRLAANTMPRLTEVTGEDGGAIEIKGVEITIRK